jgi:hypothetical protein
MSTRSTEQKPMEKKLTNVMELIKTLSENKFTGHIKINFTSGTIGKVETFEEILKK